MNRRIGLGLILIATLFLIAISLGTFSGHSQQRIDSPNTAFLEPPPQTSTIDVEVVSQAKSSLRFTNVVARSSRPEAPEITFYIENVGSKPIVAYTIRAALDCGEAPIVSFELGNILSKTKILLRSQSVIHEYSGTECPQPANKLTLSIDFIEFADGKYWGEDAHQSREKLAGMRAGARDVTIDLQSKVKKQGITQIEIASDDEANWRIPPNHTEVWLVGYRIGRNFRSAQIKRVLLESGEKAAMDKLSLPYDASAKGQ